MEYAWHPLCGQPLIVHGQRNTPSGVVLHCRKTSEPEGAVCSQIPEWMFDRAICSALTLENAPRASWEALLGLKQLLEDSFAASANTGGSDEAIPRDNDS